MNAHVIAIKIVGRLLVGSRLESEAEPLLEFLLENLRGPSIAQEKKLQARTFPVLAEHVTVAEEFGDSPQHGNYLILLYERVETRGQVGIRGQAAGHTQ